MITTDELKKLIKEIILESINTQDVILSKKKEVEQYIVDKFSDKHQRGLNLAAWMMLTDDGRLYAKSVNFNDPNLAIYKGLLKKAVDEYGDKIFTREFGIRQAVRGSNLMKK